MDLNNNLLMPDTDGHLPRDPEAEARQLRESPKLQRLLLEINANEDPAGEEARPPTPGTPPMENEAHPQENSAPGPTFASPNAVPQSSSQGPAHSDVHHLAIPSAPEAPGCMVTFCEGLKRCFKRQH